MLLTRSVLVWYSSILALCSKHPQSCLKIFQKLKVEFSFIRMASLVLSSLTWIFAADVLRHYYGHLKCWREPFWFLKKIAEENTHISVQSKVSKWAGDCCTPPNNLKGNSVWTCSMKSKFWGLWIWESIPFKRQVVSDNTRADKLQTIQFLCQIHCHYLLRHYCIRQRREDGQQGRHPPLRPPQKKCWQGMFCTLVWRARTCFFRLFVHYRGAQVLTPCTWLLPLIKTTTKHENLDLDMIIMITDEALKPLVQLHVKQCVTKSWCFKFETCNVIWN